jgi:anaerobic dimethyl sulfoxide reductase subunit B (iron-sulfur subunit)
MPTQYAFFVNSDACSGCKTCQVACKDKNDLPAGTSWRRVVEVAAGGWQKVGEAWTNTVVAYNLSVACHHCLQAPCTRQCSTDAIYKREDGIVVIDQARCTKCNKCAADCPYDAIRRAGSSGEVSKCDFCVDDLARGLPPACVAACPNRALDYGEYAEMASRHGGTDRVFPLPDTLVARPALFIKPHRHAALVDSRDPEVGNWEEI